MAFDLAKWANVAIGGIGLSESLKGGREAGRAVEKAERRLSKVYKLDMVNKRQIAANLQAIMSGDYSSLEPAFRALDTNVEAQLEDTMDQITEAERKGMRMISDTATGAAKLRLLKDLAVKTQDQRAKAIRDAANLKSTTRENMKSELTQYARGTLPTIFSQGAQLQVPSQNVELGLNAMMSNAQNAQAQMKYLMDILNPPKTSPSVVINTPSGTYRPTTTTREGLVSEQDEKDYYDMWEDWG